jgi:hypothetical protein
MDNKFPDISGNIADLDAKHLEALQAAIDAAFEAEELMSQPQLPFHDWQYGVIVGTLDYTPSTVRYLVPIIRLMGPHDAGLTPESVKQGFAGSLKLGSDKTPLILVKSPDHD